MLKPQSVDDYIAFYSVEVQKKLLQIRATIKKAAPKAEEVISYGMPGYRQNGMVVWFGAHTTHIGFYPKGTGVEAFKSVLTDYKISKGAIQFPIDKPLPTALITQMVKYNLAENLSKPKKK